MIWCVFFTIFIFQVFALPLKALHLTFHCGCAEQIEEVARQLSLDLTTWNILDLPPYFFDGYAKGNALYNIGHVRAEKIWKLHENFFRQFDLIITSDTAALSRIFLQNDSKIPLIIWICNRFDYHDGASLDCNFPDPEYYQLFGGAKDFSHVVVVANTAFEHVYAKAKGVETGSLVIQPLGAGRFEEGKNSPSHPCREKTFYLPQYHNERFFMDLSRYLSRKGIQNICGRHNGLGDLMRYKGVIHLPYAWSTIALFENLKIGVPYFIPSPEFLAKLRSQGSYWHQDAGFFFDKQMYSISEWYNEEHRELFTYFDSWKDLLVKVQACDYTQKRETIKRFAEKHEKTTLAKWQTVLQQIFPEDL